MGSDGEARAHVQVDPAIDPADVERAKRWYAATDCQPRDYDGELPQYASFVRDLVASATPASVLEFGCNAGRNLHLLREVLPAARLTGIDVNAPSVEWGRARWPDLELVVGDESWLRTLPDDAFDLTLTVSVLNHLPRIDDVARDLVRVTSGYLVLGEIVADRCGKAVRMPDPQGKLVDAAPYAYFHDYRELFEDRLGCLAILDLYAPAARGNLLDCYRLLAFTKRRDLLGSPLVEAVKLRSITRRG